MLFRMQNSLRFYFCFIYKFYLFAVLAKHNYVFGGAALEYYI